MKILYAEDEAQLSVAVTEILRMEGFEVDPVFDGGKALEAAMNNYYDVVVLDIMMPVMDGIEVLRKMREGGNHMAVLMLTAKSTVDDRIAGLTEGADDYLSKPFAMKELIARINSLIRRNSDYRHSVLKRLNIELDTNTCELKSDNGSLRLSNIETELLEYLLRNIGVYFSTDELNRNVWGGRESAEKAELYVHYLKNKLAQINSKLAIFIKNDKYALKESTAVE